MPQHEVAGALEAGREVDGADERLHRVGEDRRLHAAAGELLALAEQEVLADAEVGGHAGQRDRAHDGLADLREVALVEVEVFAEDVVRDDDAEDGVTQELQALVRRVARVLRAPGAVHEGGREEVRREVEAEALDEAVQARYREVDRRPYSRPTT